MSIHYLADTGKPGFDPDLHKEYVGGMVADTNRPALALGLPWLYRGLMLMTLAVGVPALLSAPLFEGVVRRLSLPSIAEVLGLIGSVTCAFGLWMLARARVGGRGSPWLLASAGAWSLECLGRIAEVLELASFDAGRLILAGLAMYALSRGIPWLLDRSGPRQALHTWTITRRMFAAQLLIYALVPLVSFLSEHSMVEFVRGLTAGFSFGLSALWIVFAAPYVALIISLRKTLGRAPGVRSVEDILRS